MMNYASVASGIEAPSVAWHDFGWNPVFFAEIEPFPCAVLKHHYSMVPNYGDMNNWRQWPDHKINVLIAGTPCQAFSVAGLRKSLEDERGNLTIEFVRIADRYNPEFIVWENVRGVLSTHDNSFGCFLGALVGADAPLVSTYEQGRWTDAGMVVGPKRAVAWRIFDAQYQGLAQRRERVFVVGCPRKGANPAAVLFECKGVRRNSPPRREARESVAADVAPSLTSSGRGVERAGESRGQDPVVAFDCRNGGQGEVTQTLQSHGQSYSLNAQPVVCGTLDSGGGKRRGAGTPPEQLVPEIAWCLQERDAKGPDSDVNAIAFKPGQSADSRSIGAQEDIACTLEGGGGGNNQQAIAYRTSGNCGVMEQGDKTAALNCATDPNQNIIAYKKPIDTTGHQGDNVYGDGDIWGTLPAQGGNNGGGAGGMLHQGGGGVMAVRRLTPTECLFLQGFPRGYLDIQYRGKPAADGPKYRAIGNSMAVPCIRWIGRQIQKAATATSCGVEQAHTTSCGYKLKIN